MTQYQDIFDFIEQQESAFSQPMEIYSGWDWNFKEHIKTSLFYKFGRLLTGNSDDKPVKNIVRPILNLAYRAEDIDVKDINIYADDIDKYHLSFLIKKYHDEVFVRENDLDTFFDETKEEKIDFGGALIQKVEGARPQKVPLQSIVFCDQTDMMSGPIGIKLAFSPDQLKEMEASGWGSETNGADATIDQVITLSYDHKTPDKQGGRQNKTPGNYIEVYQVWGTLPKEFLGDQAKKSDGDFVKQLQFVTFLKKENGERQGITLFRIRDTEQRFKFINRDKIYNRALGFGGAEELFEPQVWTNYSMIRKKEMLDAASKTIFKTTDAAFANRNKIMDMDNLEIATLEEGKDITQLDTFPRNFQLFSSSVTEWEEYGKSVGAAYDPVMGKESASGTPLGSVQLQVQQGLSLHAYRRGKYAKFIEEVYQDWIIPYIVSEIVKGTVFLAELSQDEMQYVSDCLVRSQTNKYIKEKILNGELVDDAEVEKYKQQVQQEFMRGGNKRFMEILKGEMKGVKLKVKVNVAGKQKDLVAITEKLSNVFRQIFVNPAILDDPRAAKIFSKILEYSGMNPLDFTSAYSNKPVQQIQQQVQQLTPKNPSMQQSVPVA